MTGARHQHSTDTSDIKELCDYVMHTNYYKCYMNVSRDYLYALNTLNELIIEDRETKRLIETLKNSPANLNIEL